MTRGSAFDYSGRAAEARAAHRAIHETFAKLKNRNDPKDPATIAWTAACAWFHRALDLAYPPDFYDDYLRLKAGDWGALETAIRFLEADPIFYRSGYMKANLLRIVKRAPLKKGQADRLRDLALAMVDRRGSQEFRYYCQLAGRLATPELREALALRAGDSDAAVAWRARRMLCNVEQALCAARAKS